MRFEDIRRYRIMAREYDIESTRLKRRNFEQEYFITQNHLVFHDLSRIIEELKIPNMYRGE